MKQYIGTKIIEAEPAYRCMDGQGRVTITDDPSEAFPNFPSVEDGYRVRYADGYVSWSPREAFEEAYRPTDTMNFGLAIEAAKRGAKIARRGWNGKGQYVELEGYLNVIDSNGKYIGVGAASTDYDYLFQNVTCYLKSDDQRQQVAAMKTNEPITVYGKITDVGEVLGFYLNIDSIG